MSGRRVDVSGAAALADRDAWISWCELGGLADATVKHYRWTVDKLLAAYPDMPFNAFTDAELLAVMLLAPPKSRQRWAAALRSWFRWGIRTRRIMVNPCQYLPDFKKGEQPVVPVFTIEQEAALRALPEPNGTLLALLFDTGLRKSEARNLTGKRIDFAAQQLIVIDGAKGGKQRLVPIDQEAAPFLLGRLDQMLTVDAIGDDDYIWPVRPGGGAIKHDRPITNPSFHGWWVACVAAAAVTYRKPHTTRHTYATRWRQRGLDMAYIQFLLGHASIVTTQRVYVHTLTEDVRRRMAAMRRSGELFT